MKPLLNTALFALVLLSGPALALKVPETCNLYTTEKALNREIPELGVVYLGQQLQAMIDMDQDIRQASETVLPRTRFTPSSEQEAFLDVWGITDATGTQFLKKTIETFGWPSTRRTTGSISRNAWLLAQHADAEPAFQACVLDLIKQDMTTPQEKSNFAYLTDRVLLAQGKAQEYGTQITFTPEGKPIPMPLRDPEKVNERRAEVGLEPIEDYLSHFGTP